MKINRVEVYNKCRGHCGYCGEKIKIEDMQVDHIIPQRNFLSHIDRKFRVPGFLSHLTFLDVHHIDNLLPTCRVCNKWKSVYDLETFRSELTAQLMRLNVSSPNYRLAKRYNMVSETPHPIVFYFEEPLKMNFYTESRHEY